ncbi:MAG: FtsX-like permease family protein, partial [Gemmatimonadetes bacterium]|nr:FtsX-like permease family protein [Gemmatimonadota bacterium]
MAWRVEISTVAVEALRRLKRSDRQAVARRIDELAQGGPPPASADGEIHDLPAGPHRLLCRISRQEQRIVVITIQHQRLPAGRVIAELAVRRIRFWTGEGWVNGIRRTLGAMRRLGRAPVFTATAVVTLALGIGAATATFAVASGVLFSTLPYGESSRVVSIWSSWSDFPKTWVSIEEFLHYRRQAASLEDVGLYFVSSHNLTTFEDPERVGSAVLTHNLFDVLGMRPAAGRFFTKDEAITEASVLVLGYDLWQRRYQGDPDVVGSQIPVNGRPWSVIGVAPPDFLLPEDFRSQSRSEIYFPLPLDVDDAMVVPVNGGSHGYFAVGRLANGVDVPTARRDLENLAARLEAQGIYQASWGFRPLVFGVREDVLGATQRMLYVLLGACGILLLISCGNVGALLLTRGDTRRHAVNIMRSLGASRRWILSELLLESAVLAAIGGALGWALASVSLSLFERLNAGAIPSGIEFALDGRVLAFGLLVTTLTVLLFGWIPSSRIAGSSEAAAAHQSARHTRGAGRGRRWVVAGQIGLSVVLLLGSGLMLRTMAALSDIDAGFRSEGVLTFRLTAPSATYPDEEAVTGFYGELLRRVRELPGVRSAGAARLLPLASQMGDAGVWAEGHVRAAGESTTAEWQWVTPGYMETMGIPVLQGRDFQPGDDRTVGSVALINEAFAQRY